MIFTHGLACLTSFVYVLVMIAQCFKSPGTCITNVFATCRKNFSQWHRSFQRKLRSHWLKFLRHVAITLVIQDPGICEVTKACEKMLYSDFIHGYILGHVTKGPNRKVWEIFLTLNTSIILLPDQISSSLWHGHNFCQLFGHHSNKNYKIHGSKHE